MAANDCGGESVSVQGGGVSGGGKTKLIGNKCFVVLMSEKDRTRLI
jgi:hypothetical protein